MTAPTALEVLGYVRDENAIAFQWHRPDGTTSETITLTEDELGTLAAEFRRDNLPLWPLEVCAFCDVDAVVEYEGDFYCAGHARALDEARGVA